MMQDVLFTTRPEALLGYSFWVLRLNLPKKERIVKNTHLICWQAVLLDDVSWQKYCTFFSTCGASAKNKRSLFSPSTAHGWGQETMGSLCRVADTPHCFHKPWLQAPMSETIPSTTRPIFSHSTIISKTIFFRSSDDTELPEMEESY